MSAPWWEVRQGDAATALAGLDDGIARTCVTSPPYFGLRDYGTGDAQIGLEDHPDRYVARLVDVFRQVRRVLANDGTVWLNLGDSYAAARSGHGHEPHRGTVPESARGTAAYGEFRKTNAARDAKAIGVKHKDLLGIPWMVAFALRADGWYLRSDVIWAKPNPMPESVTDRPTRSHEHVFLLSKSPRYYYDADAIREFYATADRPGERTSYPAGSASSHRIGEGHRVGRSAGLPLHPSGRNKRDVWTVATRPYAEAHFATFPPALIEPCILAGAPEEECSTCGEPWIAARGDRQMDLSRPQAKRAAELIAEHKLTEEHLDAVRSVGVQDAGQAQKLYTGYGRNADGVQALADEAKRALGGYTREVLLARPTRGAPIAACECGAPSRPSVVLDPFAGAGTTGVVALRRERSFVGIDLSADYCEMARERIRNDAPLFNTPAEVP